VVSKIDRLPRLPHQEDERLVRLRLGVGEVHDGGPAICPQVLERGADVQDIVNMAAVAVIDAQARSYPPEPSGRTANGPTPTIFSRL